MHVQDNFDFGVESTDDRNKLREIVEVDNIAFLRSQVLCHLQNICQVIRAGGKEGTSNITEKEGTPDIMESWKSPQLVDGC